jgi:hypothetical protein
VRSQRNLALADDSEDLAHRASGNAPCPQDPVQRQLGPRVDRSAALAGVLARWTTVNRSEDPDEGTAGRGGVVLSSAGVWLP